MEALLRIQTELVAPKCQFNSFGKYRYRSCEDILEALKPLLAKHNATLIISDDITEMGGKVFVKATATLKAQDGQESVSAYARHPTDKKGMDDSQITGATSSYARKYALNGLFCIDDNKDPDATNKHGKDKADEPETQVFDPDKISSELWSLMMGALKPVSIEEIEEVAELKGHAIDLEYSQVLVKNWGKVYEVVESIRRKKESK